jgi:hypothetical protein
VGSSRRSAGAVVAATLIPLSIAHAGSTDEPSPRNWDEIFNEVIYDKGTTSNPEWFDVSTSAYARPARSYPAPVPLAQPLPAVDGINGKIDGFGGGASHGTGFYGTSGSLTIPLAYRWGLQLDGSAGNNAGIGSEGGAGHLFWRDPSIGLLGAYGSYSHRSGFDVGVERIGADGGIDFLGTEHVSIDTARVAAEGEYYVGRWNFGAVAGSEMVGINSPLLPLSVPNRFFDLVSASYYLTDDFEVHIAQAYTFKTQILIGGAEYGLPLGGGRMASLFAEGLIGERGFQAILGGIRIYFGERGKSLIDRHRQDDPVSALLLAVLIAAQDLRSGNVAKVTICNDLLLGNVSCTSP